mmetsp:Transcript_18448/g.55072  ORF Transcript_18448/g.55072 Transcript_18448/m.55072 type:complete len:212 (-) Transcript_18448:2723-3358(-)
MATQTAYEPGRTQPRLSTTYYDACGVAGPPTRSSRAAGVRDAPVYASAFDPTLGRPVGGYDDAFGMGTWSAATARRTAVAAGAAQKRPLTTAGHALNAWEAGSLNQAGDFRSTPPTVGGGPAGTGTWRYASKRDLAASAKSTSFYSSCDATGAASLRAQDLARTPPWECPAVGHHVVPGSDSAKLVAGVYRYVPVGGNQRDGHCTLQWSSS